MAEANAAEVRVSKGMRASEAWALAEARPIARAARMSRAQPRDFEVPERESLGNIGGAIVAPQGGDGNGNLGWEEARELAAGLRVREPKGGMPAGTRGNSTLAEGFTTPPCDCCLNSSIRWT
jgi:hypothetical protein